MNLKKKLILTSTSAFLILGLGISATSNTSLVAKDLLPPEHVVKQVAKDLLPPEHAVKRESKKLT